MSRQVQQIAIGAITILNPRVRNKVVFGELVTSIERLGLKKPITVSRRREDVGYNLVCGQGRLEAYVALNQTEIPALVIDATEEDCFVMSLVENLARRHHAPLELMREIGVLRDRHSSIAQIAGKTGFSQEYVSAICFLLDHGEERLLSGIERGVIPVTVAMEIARSDDGDLQVALADAYEKRLIRGKQIFAIRRIIELRAAGRKTVAPRSGPRTRTKKRVTADELVRSYRKETQRQQALVRRAAVSQGRLLFVVNGLRLLLQDEHFHLLLRTEGLNTLPMALAEQIRSAGHPE